MRFLLTLFLLVATVFLSRGVRAEGGTCPPGYYPVNSPGVMGCAPIPSSGGFSLPEGPIWESRWGAIAVDFKKGAYGSVSAKGSKRQAQREARKSCRSSGGGKDCKISLTYFNQCGVMARGDAYAVTQGAGSIDDASRIAVERCSEHTQNCRIVLSGCSFPVRVD